MKLVGSLLYEADELIGTLVKSRLPNMQGRSFGPFVAVGVVRSGIILGGIVWHNFRGFSIEVSIAFDRADWIRPSTLRNIAGYPFNQLGVTRVTAIVGRKNEPMRKLCEKLGFKLEGIGRKAFDGKQDAVLYGILRHECKWLKSFESKKINGHISTNSANTAKS